MPKLTRDETRLLICIVLLIGLSFFAYVGAVDHAKKLEAQEREKREGNLSTLLFSDISFEAKAVYVYDSTNEKLLYAKNEEEVLPLASLTKIMTAVVANRDIPEKDRITIKAAAINQTGEGSVILGESWERDPLTKLMLISSSNDAAKALGEHIDSTHGRGYFVTQMNETAVALGFPSLHFSNENGLDLGGIPGGIGNAKDVAMLFLKAHSLMEPVLLATALPSSAITDVRGVTRTIENTNDLTSLDVEIFVSKTGYTSLAGGNLGIIFRVPVSGETVVAVVLGADKETRFSDMQTVLSVVSEYYQRLRTDTF